MGRVSLADWTKSSFFKGKLLVSANFIMMSLCARDSEGYLKVLVRLNTYLQWVHYMPSPSFSSSVPALLLFVSLPVQFQCLLCLLNQDEQFFLAGDTELLRHSVSQYIQ